MIEHELRSLT